MNPRRPSQAPSAARRSYGPVRSRRLAARLWWALLPYAGWIGYRDKELERDGTCVPPPWYAFPLAWLWEVVRRLPGSAPYEPLPPIECDCDYCRGVPGAVFEP